MGLKIIFEVRYYLWRNRFFFTDIFFGKIRVISYSGKRKKIASLVNSALRILQQLIISQN